jgi:hypothetical protein
MTTCVYRHICSICMMPSASSFSFSDGGVKQTIEVKNRGYGFLIPIGKMLTQHEEKNDVRFSLLCFCAIVSLT